MTLFDYILVGILVLLAVYVIARVVSTAYYQSKRDYERVQHDRSK